MLAVGHHPGHHYPAAVGTAGELGRSRRPEPVQFGARQLHRRAPRGEAEGPQVVGDGIERGRLGEHRRLGPHHDPGQAVGGPLGRGTGSPQQAAPGGRPRAVCLQRIGTGGVEIECAGGGQRLELRTGHPGPAHQVLLAVPRAAGGDPLGHRVAQAPHRSEPQAQRRAVTGPFERRAGVALVHVRATHRHPVASGVGHQALR